MPSEHFGIAIVEAMAAGLIPVVPDCGGPAEFVPKRYQYHTLANAAEIVEKYINVSQCERLTISRIAGQFCKEEFKSRMKMIVGSMIS
jgi:glycosyltransferase involved in cell wall biosynthesis